MKTLQNSILGFLLLTVTAALAQEGLNDPYNVYSGYGPTGYGRRRNMPLTEISKLSKEEQQKIREATVSKTVEKLTALLRLDELQEIVITKALTDNQKKHAAITEKESDEALKSQEKLALLDFTDRQIMSYLNKDQKDKFNALLEERKASVSSKK